MQMKGYRKLILGVCFVLSATFLCYVGIKEKTNLLYLATVIGAISTGLLSIVYGNIKERELEKNEKSVRK